MRRNPIASSFLDHPVDAIITPKRLAVDQQSRHAENLVVLALRQRLGKVARTI